ncbi:MAG: hypothetical protein IT330_18690 [Anaerolineae bacterium]|nr:hypothetical protein [Anaerolineae bacterium]
MNSRERINSIFARRTSDRVGFWTGNPKKEFLDLHLPALGLSEREEFYRLLDDDCRWISADGGYKHPEKKPPFDMLGGKARTSTAEEGCLAHAESLAEVEAIPWPNPDYCDFSSVIARIRQYPDKAVFTGWWSSFWHYTAEYFGMENYFMRLYTHPKIVEAVNEHVVSFLVEANRRFFQALGDDADIFFIGNDWGSQHNLLMSPEAFQKFVLPGFKRIIDVAKSFNKKVLLHSCGSIAKAIPMLIDAGIDALHPLQAKAKGMDAVTLSRLYKGHIAFVGGVDAQHLLVYGTPQQIKDEVHRLRDLCGPHYVVSGSHEAVLIDHKLENIMAMAEAARE